LFVGETDIDPLAIINGVKPGPIPCISGGIHGDSEGDVDWCDRREYDWV